MSTSSGQEAAPETKAPEPTPDDPDTRSRGERFETSLRGRWLISLFVLALVGSLLVINAPATETKRILMAGVGPFLGAIGMEQGWGVFSPNPRRFSLDVEARLLQRDGSTRVVRIIPEDRGLTEYWNYRWQRWGDNVATGRDNQMLLAPYARWLAAQDRDDGGQPVRVGLVSRRAATMPPGDGPPRGPVEEREFFAIGVGS